MKVKDSIKRKTMDNINWYQPNPRQKENLQLGLFCNGKAKKVRDYKSSIEASLNARRYRSQAVIQRFIELPVDMEFCQGSLHFLPDATPEQIPKIKSKFTTFLGKLKKKYQFNFQYSAIQHPTDNGLHFDFVAYHNCPFKLNWLKRQISTIWKKSGGRYTNINSFDGTITTTCNYIFKADQIHKAKIKLPLQEQKFSMVWQSRNFFDCKTIEVEIKKFVNGELVVKNAKQNPQQQHYQRYMARIFAQNQREQYLPDFETAEYQQQSLDEMLRNYRQQIGRDFPKYGSQDLKALTDWFQREVNIKSSFARSKRRLQQDERNLNLYIRECSDNQRVVFFNYHATRKANYLADLADLALDNKIVQFY